MDGQQGEKYRAPRFDHTRAPRFDHTKAKSAPQKAKGAPKDHSPSLFLESLARPGGRSGFARGFAWARARLACRRRNLCPASERLLRKDYRDI